MDIANCLWFDSQAQEAAELYTSLVPGSGIDNVTPYPSNTGESAGNPMTVEFHLGDQKYIGLNGGPYFQHTPAYSVSLTVADQAEVDRLWEALLAGGGVESQCGWLSDRFGVSWQIVPKRMMELFSDPDPEVVARVNAKMLTMVKLDVAELEAAALP